MWKEQYARLGRSIARVKAHYAGRSGYSHFGPEDVAAFRDDVIHAFQDVFHLRDWLVRDPTVAVPEKEIKQLYKDNPSANPSLHLARDVANGSKHLENTRPSVDADAAVAKTSNVNVNLAGRMEDTVFSHNVNVELGGGKSRDALKLLEDCQQEISAFLKAKGLA